MSQQPPKGASRKDVPGQGAGGSAHRGQSKATFTVRLGEFCPIQTVSDSNMTTVPLEEDIGE